MGLDYLKITPEIMVKISAYDEEQQGRLVMAMIRYALDGTEPQFEGMEKFIWPTLKMDIDRCAASIEKQTANGSKGGRPSKFQQKETETQQKPTETQQNPVKPNESHPEPNKSLNSNTNTNINSNTKKEDVVDMRATAAADGDESITWIDGDDLTEHIKLNGEVDVLLKKYRMSEAVRGDLLDDIEEHGLEKVKRVLQEAAKSDTKGGISLNFYRACLKNDGKVKPARAAPAGQKDQMMRYTPEERKATYSAAVVNFDEE